LTSTIELAKSTREDFEVMNREVAQRGESISVGSVNASALSMQD